MASFLDSRFLEVPEDNQIVTDSFLNSCENIVLFLDHFGAVFSPVRKDIRGNIDKIRKRLLEDPAKFGTLELIIDTELAETDKKLKLKGNQGIATNALMWLRRGLLYISRFFHHLLDKDYFDPAKETAEKLGPCASMAYEESLKKYHGWIVSGIFAVAMKAAPYRKTLLKDISGGCDDMEEKTLEAIKDFSVNFDVTITTIEKMYKDKGVEQEYVV